MTIIFLCIDRSLESKYSDISKLYRALNEFKNHKTNTDET